MTIWKPLKMRQPALNTPELCGRLAEAGVSFPNCTVNAPVCAALTDCTCIWTSTFSTWAQWITVVFCPLRCRPTISNSATTVIGSDASENLILRNLMAITDATAIGRAPTVGGSHIQEECEGKMHAGSSPTPIGPYTHYLEEKGVLKAFHADYRKRSSGGWIKNGSHDSVLSSGGFRRYLHR